MTQIPLDDELDALQSELPHHLGALLRRSFSGLPPQAQFRTLSELLAGVQNRLADLLNSVYSSSDAPPQKGLEVPLLSAMAGNISHGKTMTLVKELFTKQRSELPDGWWKCWNKKLPEPCRQFIKAARLIKEARTKYEIPTHRLKGYVQHQLNNIAGRGGLNDLFLAWIQFRNADAHNDDPKHSWWEGTPEWFSLMNHYFQPAVHALLCFEPLRRLLTTLEVVELSGTPMPVDGGWKVRINRSERPLPLLPLQGSVLLLAEPPKATSYVARREAFGVLHACFPFSSFPTARVSKAERKRKYRLLFLRSYLEHGLISDDLLESLEEERQNLGLNLETAEQLREELQSSIQRVRKKLRDGHEDALSVLHEWLIPTDWPDLRAQLLALDSVQERYVREAIADNVVASRSKLLHETGLAPEMLDAILERLEKDGQIREIPGAGTERNFKHRDRKLIERFEGILSELNSAPTRVDRPVRELLSIIGKLLIDEGEDFQERLTKLIGESVGEDQKSAVEPFIPWGPLQVRNKTISLVSAEEMAKNVLNIVRKKLTIPLEIEPGRYLLAHQPVHKDGTPFKRSMSVDGGYVELGWPATRLVFILIGLLAQAGERVKLGKVEFIQASSIEAVSENDTDSDELIKIWITIGGTESLICGKTVPQFYAALIRCLVDGANLPPDKLPIRSGWIRTLLSRTPVHQDQQLFRRPMLYKGYYIECAQGRTTSVMLALHLCKILEIPARSVEGGPRLLRSPSGIDLSIEVLGEKVTGQSVPDFLSELVKLLWKKQKLQAKHLPWSLGPTRYLLNHEPRHPITDKHPDHPQGRPFKSKRQVSEGLWLESNMSRGSAMGVARALIEALTNEDED